MKLLSFKRPGGILAEIGCVASDDKIVALVPAYNAAPEGMGGHESFPTDMIEFIKGGEKTLKMAEDALCYANANQNQSFLFSEKDIDFLPPVMNPGKIISAGMNYSQHIEEGGGTRPEVCLAYNKASSSLIGHRGEIL